MTLLAVTPSFLQVLWLVLIAVLWIGFLFLDGFDFGVAMLLPFVGRNDKERRVIVNTIGPVWDGNEVWLLTAGGAMFAAFSGWYATLFSALYLPLLLILLGLILRGVAFEYRGKRPDWAWRNRWDWAAAIGSLLPPLVFGVGFANFLIGLPLKDQGVLGGTTTAPLFNGTFLGLFSVYGLVGGITFVLVFLTHGAIYAALKTKGEISGRLKKLAVTLGLITALPAVVFVVWGNLLPKLPGQLDSLRMVSWVAGLLGLVAFVAAVLVVRKGREGIAFILTGTTIALVGVMIFAQLYPGLGFNNTGLQAPLDITTASSSPTTLTLMSIAAAILVPVVLAYQIWAYSVFRRRLGVENIPDESGEPVAVVG
ncbi:MAG: cytochrome d ubiquinol oxidase subunit II [Actinobacteria bacterium]|nr:cytochrome d ubiquinol oxidase subunit II [Actinomycetota bacterium]